MEIRGRRRCASCGARWSYAETGSAACPDCGSLRSVALDDGPVRTTDTGGDLDLDAARAMVDDRPLAAVAEAAGSAARSYRTARGFIAGGELEPLDGTFLAAVELRYVADRLRRGRSVDEATEAYFLDLLAGAASGERPDSIPASLRADRGLAAADAVEAYRRDLRRYVDDHPHPELRPAVERLRAHEKRIAAVGGDVPQSEADALVLAARELGKYLRAGDETALARAEDRLDRLD